ncbi:MAG: glycosyltransferase [Planctomycetes bacterium]|nr:glycosyltransferase [Planctomycetota bacterium]
MNGGDGAGDRDVAVAPPGSIHLLHLFSTFAAGGPQVRTATLIHALPPAFRHTIVGLDGNFACRERLAEHPRVAYAEPPRKSRLGAYAWRLGRLIKRVRPDLVLTYNWGAIEAIPGARWFGFRRLIHGEDGFGPDESGGQLARRVRFRRLVLPLVQRVVVPSATLLRHAQEGWRVPEARRVLIPNGIDLDHFAPEPVGPGGALPERAALRARFGLDAGAPVIATVARLRKEKGLELLIDAVATLTGAQLLIAGDGPEETALRARVQQRGVTARVRFAGNLPDPRDAYRAADLFAMSSHTEQMPISLVEAMGCGLAAVSTAVGDVAAMVAPENARWIVAGRAPEVLAGALDQALRDAAARAAAGAANRAKALREYAVGTMVARYRALYASVLAG